MAKAAGVMGPHETSVLRWVLEDGPLRFSNGIKASFAHYPVLAERYGSATALEDGLRSLEGHGLVRTEFYGTGAVHEFSLTKPGWDYFQESIGAGALLVGPVGAPANWAHVLASGIKAVVDLAAAPRSGVPPALICCRFPVAEPIADEVVGVLGTAVSCIAALVGASIRALVTSDGPAGLPLAVALAAWARASHLSPEAALLHASEEKVKAILPALWERVRALALQRN